MSLVTTASATSSASARHSAATRAVLPEPTGPPTPIRNGRRTPWVTAAAGACSGAGPSWECPCPSSECPWPFCSSRSGCKESHLPVVVALGKDVEQGSGRGRQQGQPGGVGVGEGGRLIGQPVDGVGQPGERRGDLDRVQAEQPYGGRRQTGGRSVQHRQRGVHR